MKLFIFVLKCAILLVLGAAALALILPPGWVNNIVGFIYGYNVPRLVLTIDRLMTGNEQPKEEKEVEK